MLSQSPFACTLFPCGVNLILVIAPVPGERWMDPTRKEKFCWGVVATFCERIQPKQDSFQWAESHANVIEKMGEIYGLYCQRQNFKRDSDQCILKGKLKPDICSCQPEAKKYYEWIQQIHNVFSYWNHKLLILATNHDDMLTLACSHNKLLINLFQMPS